MFAVNHFQQSGQLLVAACDPELLDQDYQEGDIHLSVPSAFYDGERVDEAGLLALLKMCTIANLVGAKTIQIAVSLGLIEQANVGTVDGVPHAQFMAI